MTEGDLCAQISKQLRRWLVSSYTEAEIKHRMEWGFSDLRCLHHETSVSSNTRSKKDFIPAHRNQKHLHRKSCRDCIKSVLSRWGRWIHQAKVTYLTNKNNYCLKTPKINTALQTLTTCNITMQLLAARGLKGTEQCAASLLTCLGIEKKTQLPQLHIYRTSCPGSNGDITHGLTISSTKSKYSYLPVAVHKCAKS